MSYLSDFKEFNRGYATFREGANGGRIIDKGTIKNGNLDFEDVYFVKELMFNLFSVSQICDRKYTWVFSLATKDETTGILKKFITEIENLVDKKVKVIRCDNRTEFKNSVMNDFCAMKGIRREFSVARTPQQNGVAERRNKTLIEAAKTIKPHNKTTYELFRGRTPALSFMRPFRCHVTILNTLDYLGKFDEKADKGFFVGYFMNSKAFRVYNIRTRRVEENLHIEFLENKPIVAGDGPEWLFDIDMLTKSMNYVPVVAGTNCNDFAGTKDSIGADKESGASNELNYAFENLNIEYPDDSKMPGMETIETYDDSEEEADFTNLESLIYVEAMQKELFHFKLQKVWILVDLPKGKKAIGTKWVFRNKKDERGIMIKNKARLVAQGYTQEEGIDYDEVFAHVARIEAIRLFLSYASFLGFMVYQMDVKSTFLYERIEEEELCVEFKRLMKDKFQMSSMRELTFFLGLQVKQKENGIFISQDKYVDEVLRKFNFLDVKFASTPVDTENTLVKDAYSDDVDVHLYRSIIRSLMYLIASKPDIILISWQCKKQIMVATSITEAEYVAATSCCGQTATVITVDNGEQKITAIVDGKEFTVTEASVRRHL
uniref:Integrase catalytic domain-containing protein n=1 Tax=Tanacetum cinerariifolium TaxID=118510 RepID=A0A6L2M9P5_TANCI|nr:hypothetical protein [Tanacetum cinerariifolium]